MILALRTDQPQAEMYLLDGSGVIVSQHSWHAHRQLADTLLASIETLLCDTDWSKLRGIIVFQGPGSFTGLRIGITTANTIAYSLGIPIVGTQHDDWIDSGYARLVAAGNDHIVIPHYGADPRITAPRK